MQQLFKTTLYTGIASALISTASAAITFEIEFTAQANTQYTNAEKQAFRDGLAYWDSVIDGHQDNVNRTFTLEVDSFSQAAVGGSVTLGSAGPRSLIFSNVVPGAPTSDQRFIIARGGRARFNTHADAGPLSATVILHEIGHTLGLGTLWEDNEIYNDGNAGTGNRTGSGNVYEYNGAFGVAAYKAEYVSSATFIPVEQAGGQGTAHGHWDEVDGGNGLTGITDSMGRDFRDEVMTGWASSNIYVSNTTIQSLRDIGFTLHPVPEPSSTALLGLGSIALLLRRRK